MKWSTWDYFVYKYLKSLYLSFIPYSEDLEIIPTKIFDMEFHSPIGLAAGFDKDAKYIQSLQRFGFGFVELGSVTEKPNKGNKFIKKDRDSKTLYNALGLPNCGIDKFLENLTANVLHKPIGINISFVNDKSNKSFDVREMFTKIKQHMIGNNRYYITINLSCPAYLEDCESVLCFIHNLEEHKKTTEMDRPIFIKIAPTMCNNRLLEICDALNNTKDISLLLGNSTPIKKDGVDCGMSGCIDRTVAKVKIARGALRDDLPIIGCGGIRTPDDAKDVLDAGASAIQLYSGLVFNGFDLIKQIHNKLLDRQNKTLNIARNVVL